MQRWFVSGLFFFFFFFPFFFFARPWQNLAGRKRSKNNPEAGMVPLPTPEPGLWARQTCVARGLRSGQQPLASRQELTAFRACLKAGERLAQGGLPCVSALSPLLATIPHAFLRKKWGLPGAGWAEPCCPAADPNYRFRYPFLSFF